MVRSPGKLAVLIALVPAAGGASGYRSFYGYAYGDGPGYPLSLPQTLRGTVSVPLGDAPVRPADTLAQLYPVLAACWKAPSEPGKGQATARFSLRRDGSLIGAARISYAAGVTPGLRAGLLRSALDAIRRCTPADITPGLGRAIAGRPVALRFVLER